MFVRVFSPFSQLKILGMRRSQPVAIKALFSVPHPQDHRDGMRSPIPSFIAISKKGGRDQYKSYRQGNIYNIPGTSMNTVHMCIYINMICYIYICRYCHLVGIRCELHTYLPSLTRTKVRGFLPTTNAQTLFGRKPCYL